MLSRYHGFSDSAWSQSGTRYLAPFIPVGNYEKKTQKMHFLQTDIWHYTICLKVISSSGLAALSPAFAPLEQRGEKEWSNFHQKLWQIWCLTKCVTNIVTKLITKFSESPNLSLTLSPSLSPNTLGLLYAPRTVIFKRRKKHGILEPLHEKIVEPLFLLHFQHIVHWVGLHQGARAARPLLLGLDCTTGLRRPTKPRRRPRTQGLKGQGRTPELDKL